MLNIMLDLETMGRSPDGAIASIGMIKFDPDGDTLQDPFYLPVRLEGQDVLGMTFFPDTIVWWLQQSKAAQEAIVRGDRVDLFNALSQVNNYVGENGTPVWAYGSTFDHVILQTAFDRCRIKSAIGYRQQVCMRALAQRTTIERPKVGEEHNALDDATAQAIWLQKILNAGKH